MAWAMPSTGCHSTTATRLSTWSPWGVVMGLATAVAKRACLTGISANHNTVSGRYRRRGLRPPPDPTAKFDRRPASAQQAHRVHRQAVTVECPGQQVDQTKGDDKYHQQAGMPGVVAAVGGKPIG